MPKIHCLLSPFSVLSFLIFKIFTYLFLAALGLCSARAFSSCSEQGLLQLWCMGLSLWWFLLLQSMGSRCAGLWHHEGSGVVTHGLSCSMACEFFLGPGIESMSPPLAGGFLTTEPREKPLCSFEMQQEFNGIYQAKEYRIFLYFYSIFPKFYSHITHF